ncbi:hypothetical protein RCL_jg20087.t1 [Rhizophagus clarus]|uniref:Uncharacterized protein n=1 Tax=Rhizophagus clarus TaxID=94130 RepID=A0A8H3LB68_9GLOM|nr:hypothetical protein RCL_jg20087.t1 [Rhizophagus clarus]
MCVVTKIVHNSKDQLFKLIIPLIQDNVNSDHNEVFAKIDNLDCWNSLNIEILCLAKGIIPKSFSKCLKDLKIPEQSKFKITKEVINTLVLQFKYLILKYCNIHQITLEQLRGIDSQKKKSKFVKTKDNNRIKDLSNILSTKYKVWIDGYFNIDDH